MKLVTCLFAHAAVRNVILIHTSVKLVTRGAREADILSCHFNPHEREARDAASERLKEINDILIHTSVKLVTLRQNAPCAASSF